MALSQKAGRCALACVFVSLLTPPADVFAQQCTAPSLSTGGAVTSSSAPDEMALGDFNHDRFPDVAVVNSFSNTVAILRGGASLTVLTTLNFPSATDVVVADFDHNGWDDVAVSGIATNRVYVWLAQNITGAFVGGPASYNVGIQPDALTFGDYDDDGHLDLAVFNSFEISVNILRGSVTGSFTVLSPFTLAGASQLATGDVDHDGDLDLVSVNPNDNQVHAALGDGGGGFPTIRDSDVNPNGAPEGLALADFNRDGTLDVVTVNTVNRELEYLRGDGGGNFVSADIEPIGAGSGIYRRIAASDMDRDGDLDVVMPDGNANKVFVSLNDGAGDFGAPVSFSTDGNAFDAVVADFDRDSRTDVVTSLPAANKVQILLNDFGTPCVNPSFERLGRSFALGAGASPVSITVGDYNLDGNVDFVTANQGTNEYEHWSGTGTGSFVNLSSGSPFPNPVSNVSADIDVDLNVDPDVVMALDGMLRVLPNGVGPGSSIPLPANPYQVAAADVSFDGKVDLVVSLVTNDVLVFLNDGFGGFPSFTSYPVGANPRSVVVADFDNDGLPDIAVGVDDATDHIDFLRNTGGGLFTSAGSVNLTAPPTALRAANMNGDFDLDLVVTVGTGAGGAKLQIYTGSGPFSFGLTFDQLGGDTTATRHGLEIGDFNEDGKNDVAVALSPTPRVRIFLGNGAGSISGTLSEVTPVAPGALAAADTDRDGTLDLLVTLPSTGQVLSLRGNGAGRFSPEFYSPPSLPDADSRGVAYGDFNLDGRLDVVIANRSDNSVTRFLGNGDGTFLPGSTFSISPATGPVWVSVGDFDNNGKPDIVASAASGDLVVLRGNGTGGFPGPHMVTSVGGTPFINRTADFDFDGNLDVAVLTGNIVRVMSNPTGTGSFAPLGNESLAGFGTGLWVGDFNGNGLLDMVATETTDDELVTLTAASTSDWTALSVNIGRDPGDFDAADFNGDGFVDFVIPLEADDQVKLVLSNGTGGFNPPGPVFNTSKTPGAVRALDWNYDGFPDLVVTSKGDHVLAFHRANGFSSFFTPMVGTAGVRIPTYLTVADFNSDARLDVAVVPDTVSPISPPGVAVVLNTNCRPRQLKIETDVSTCNTPGPPFVFAPQPMFRFLDDGENLVQCENRDVTASVLPGTGNGNASGTTSITPSSGQVSFTNLGVDSAGIGYVMQFEHAEARRKLSRRFTQGLAPTINGPFGVCEGASAFYNSEPNYERYDWRLDFTSVSMASAVDLTGNLSPTPPNHNIDLMVRQDACTAGANTTVTVTANLSDVDLSPSGPIFLCPNCTGPIATATPIGGMGPFNYEWGYRTVPMTGSINSLGEFNPTYTIEAADFVGTGPFYLVATLTPFACGAATVSTEEIEIDVSTSSTLEPLAAFTALSTQGQNLLEYAKTPSGTCSSVRVLRDETAFPTDPHSPGLPGDIPCPPPINNKTFFVDGGLTDGVNYYYSAWVKDAAGSFSPVKNLKGRPFNHTVGRVKWAYSTGYTAMSQAGLRISAGVTSGVYIVSNDSMVHAISAGPSGGMWLTPAIPAKLGEPSQARPPVVSFPVGAAPGGAAFVTSQDGKLYALDADSLANAWLPVSVDDDSVTGAAAGMFNGPNVVFAVSNNGSLPNKLKIFNVGDGSFAGMFDNGGGASAIGPIVGGMAVDLIGKRVFFGSWPGASPDTLWAVDVDPPNTPSWIWSKPIGHVSTTPVYLGGTPGKIVVGTVAGDVELRDADTGNSVWSGPFVASNGAVKNFVFPHNHGVTKNFMFSTDDKVWSIRDEANPMPHGELNWQVDFIPSPSTPIFLPGKTSALVGGGDGKLYRLTGVDTPTPGILDLTLSGPTTAVGVPTFDVPNQMIYVGTEEGVIYAIQYPFP